MPSGNGRNFGPAVSGYLLSNGRAFETTVFQAGKPVLDKEFNLAQDIDSGYALELSKSMAPSGWLTDIHTNSSDAVASLFTSSPTANTLVLANNLKALVNGWTIPVSYTGSASTNQLTLPAGPVGNGSKRTDLVILEVWRRLIGPSGSDGKSHTSRIWWNGNVKIPVGLDAVLNYVDEMLDPVVGAETTKRVQIQYRLRVVSGVNLFTYPSGINDPVVVANTVPASPASPDGVASAFGYVNDSSFGDPGLWVAGDGNPSNSLGTVDGFMYAIPLCAVFRRNTTSFSRNLNHNGGVVSPGPSDRPDGLFSDIFVSDDIVDLRQAVSPHGWDYQEVLSKNFGMLLDNKLKTEWVTTAIGGGVSGHSVLWADEIGTLPGDGTITGDTPGAEFQGQFDCTRRFFTDRPNYEVMSFQITPGDPNVSTLAWENGTEITIDPTLISQWPFSATLDFFNRAPPGTRVVDVLRARVQGALGPLKALDVGFSSTGNASAVPIPIKSVQGLCSYPLGDIVITIGTPPEAVTTEPMYIDLLIAYPPGQGLRHTPVEDFGTSSFFVNNPSALPATAPVMYAGMVTQSLDYPHRQVQLQYRTSQRTFVTSAESSTTEANFFLPERVHSLIEVRVNGSPDLAATLTGTSGRKVHLSSAASPGDVIEVDYEALRAIPQSGVQFTIYYKTRAPQTIRGSSLGTDLSLVPRWISPHLYLITTGSGSRGEGYPYPYAYVQTGGIIKSVGTFSGEHELDGDPETYIADFNASTGFLRVPAYIPYVPDSESVSFSRGLGDADIEARTYFSTFAAGYKPNAFGPQLSNLRVHKVVLPTLMELPADGSLGRKGTLFMVNLIRWAEFDAESSVKVLGPLENTTIASVYRVSGNLLNRRI